MDKLNVPSPSNGFPFNNDDIKFFLGLGSYSNGIYQALEGILSAFGTNFIVSGCGVTGSNIAEGWVMLGGELIKVDAHTATDDYFEKVTTYNSDGNKQTQLGSTEDAYEENRATASASSGTLESPVTGSPDYLLKPEVLDLIRNDSDFAASETNRGSLRIADETTARTGSDNTEAMTTLRVLDAIRNGTAYLAQTNYPGVRELATQTEVNNGTSSNIVTPATLAGKDGGILRKVIDIGDWNMDTTTSVSIPHGLTYSKIIGISSVIIRNDANSLPKPLDYDLGSGAAGHYSYSSTDVILTRHVGDEFDSTNYDSTSFNRGWIIIDYIA